MGFSMRRKVVLSLLAVVALAGCNQFRANERAALAILGPMCPSTAVLGDAVTVTKLRPGSPVDGMPDPANVMFMAEMSQAQIECDYEPEENSLTVDLDFGVRASRGGAAGPTDPPIEFFVAVIDIDGNMLVKRVYQNQPNLGGMANGQWVQRVRNFSVPIDADHRPYDYEILTGFQLTPAELAYNRAPKPVTLRRP
jgi:hypothetical protein